MTRRLHDWQIKMEAFICARRAQPFAWGDNDCAIFAADFVLAITGADPAPPGMRQHKTAKQAVRALKRHGGLIGIATSVMGNPVSALTAHIGDLVLCKAGKRDMLAICNGMSALAPSSAGLVSVPLESSGLCWRVV